jgi:hypothetical protein
VRFRSPASTILLADTQVTLLGGNSSPNLALRHGTMVVDENVADPVQVSLPGGRVLVERDGASGAQCQMVAEGNASTVTVQRGTAEIHGMGAPVILHAGQSGRVEAGPQGGPQVAGRISKEIPKGVIQRQGETQELPLAVDDKVDWNDQVRTLEAGRAQIMLLDGSILNVGARSTIKVLKHDPQTQQTEIELTLGKVQANVTKITAPGGKFELRTKSAVIGTVDTSWVAQVDPNNPDRTTVCDVDGTTKVYSINPNPPPPYLGQTLNPNPPPQYIGGSLTLNKGECVIVIFGQPLGSPFAGANEIASMLNQTSIVTGSVGAAGIGPALVVGIGVAGGGAIGATIGDIVLAAPAVTSPLHP